MTEVTTFADGNYIRRVVSKGSAEEKSLLKHRWRRVGEFPLHGDTLVTYEKKRRAKKGTKP